MTASSASDSDLGVSTADLATNAVLTGGGHVVGAAPPPHSPPRSLIGQALHDTFGQTGARLGAAWIVLVAVLGVFAPFLANSHPLVMRTRGGGISLPLFMSLGPLDIGAVVYFAFAVWLVRRKAPPMQKILTLLWPIAVIGIVLVIAWFGTSLITLRVFRPGWLAERGGVLRWVWVILINALILALALAVVAVIVAFTVRFFGSWVPSRAFRFAAVLTAAVMAIVSLTVQAPANVIYEHYRELENAGKVQYVVHTIVPYSPNDRLRDRPEEVLQPPNRVHWFGTTNYGEDMLSRMLHACRVALTIGFIATGISTVIGIAVGGLMGYYAGATDLFGMRLVEIVEAIPRLILLLIITVFFGRSLYLMMVVIGLVSWTENARFIRAEFLKLRKLDFVQAAVAAGLRRSSIIFRHMLPNGVAPVLVSASFGIASAILLESILSFLGLGLGPDDPSWGQLLEQARTGGTGFNWWIATFPGLAIFLTVFSYILIGEAMRDAIDPKLRKRD